MGLMRLPLLSAFFSCLVTMFSFTIVSNLVIASPPPSHLTLTGIVGIKLSVGTALKQWSGAESLIIQYANQRLQKAGVALLDRDEKQKSTSTVTVVLDLGHICVTEDPSLFSQTVKLEVRQTARLTRDSTMTIDAVTETFEAAGKFAKSDIKAYKKLVAQVIDELIFHIKLATEKNQR